MTNGASCEISKNAPATSVPITMPNENELVTSDDTLPVSLGGVMSPITATSSV